MGIFWTCLRYLVAIVFGALLYVGYDYYFTEDGESNQVQASSSEEDKVEKEDDGEKAKSSESEKSNVAAAVVNKPALKTPDEQDYTLRVLESRIRALKPRLLSADKERKKSGLTTEQKKCLDSQWSDYDTEMKDLLASYEDALKMLEDSAGEQTDNLVKYHAANRTSRAHSE